MSESFCLLIVPGIKSFVHRERFTTNYEFPRGPLALATFLNSMDCSTSLLPLDYYLRSSHTTDDIEEQIYSILLTAINEHNPSIIGISVPYTLLYPVSLKIAQYCRQIKPDTFLVMGGSHVTYHNRSVFDDSSAPDAVVRGEGEWTFLELADTVKKGKTLDNTAGITYRENSIVRENPQRPLGPIEKLPVPDYGLLPEAFVRTIAVSLVASRGCAYQCTYCGESLFWGNKVRRVPVDNIIEEMKMLSNKYDNYPVGFEDSMFHMQSSYFYDFCAKLENVKVNPNIYLLSRVDTINDQGIEAMMRAGFKNIILGVESASPKVLKMMNKRISPERAEQACRKSAEKGLIIGTFWITGHPGDTPEEAELTIRAIDDYYRKGITHTTEVALFVPYPGTPVYNEPEKHGVEIVTYDWEKWGRFNTEPVIRLKDFSEKEILYSWMRAKALSEKWKPVVSERLIKKKNSSLTRLDSQAAPTGKKIGRNDPCTCGSGKKYKKCCSK